MKSNGSQGSRWETRLIVKKNGEVISNEVEHTVTYKGHNPVIRRNSSAFMVNENGETVVPTESSESSGAETSQTPENPAPSGSSPEPTAPEPSESQQGPQGPGEIPNSEDAMPLWPGNPGGESQTQLAAPKPED